MIIRPVVVGPFQSNCFVVGCEETKKGIVIDPGDDPQKILRIIDGLELDVEKIFLTHGHIDHVRGCGEIHQRTGAEILIHPEDVALYESVAEQAELFGLVTNSKSPKPSRLVKEGEIIEFGKVRGRVLYTPGHSPGSITLVVDGHSKKPTVLFVGDLLFMNGVGRTDLWGGSTKLLLKSIKEQLMSFPDDTIVYPGHGPETTIGYERKTNPFLIDSSLWV
jgi:glyoxylase-like metal-dependent hydrolase (beta-lactamase superfamily II)